MACREPGLAGAARPRSPGTGRDGGEAATVNRNLDILARTPDGRAIAIENQYLKTDHDHLTRGLAYAVGHEAKALVVISEDHGAEFVAIADYLNSAYEQMGQDRGIAVFLVRLTVERIGKSFVPRFSVVSRPNTWLEAVHGDEEIGARTVSAFLESCTESVRDSFKTILEEWAARPAASMRINPKSASVSLDLPYVPGQTSRSVYVLYGSGVMTVNRGYFIEFGSLSEERVRQLDEALQRHFPALKERPYYPSVPRPDPTQTAEFANWLIALMETPYGSASSA
jgi:hypothetical protein